MSVPKIRSRWFRIYSADRKIRKAVGANTLEDLINEGMIQSTFYADSLMLKFCRLNCNDSMLCLFLFLCFHGQCGPHGPATNCFWSVLWSLPYYFTLYLN